MIIDFCFCRQHFEEPFPFGQSWGSHYPGSYSAAHSSADATYTCFHLPTSRAGVIWGGGGFEQWQADRVGPAGDLWPSSWRCGYRVFPTWGYTWQRTAIQISFDRVGGHRGGNRRRSIAAGSDPTASAYVISKLRKRGAASRQGRFQHCGHSRFGN